MALWVRLVCSQCVFVAEYTLSRSRLHAETPLAVGSARYLVPTSLVAKSARHKPPRLSMRVSCNGDIQRTSSDNTQEASAKDFKLPVVPADCPSYFTANTPPGLISIIQMTGRTAVSIYYYLTSLQFTRSVINFQSRLTSSIH